MKFLTVSKILLPIVLACGISFNAAALGLNMRGFYATKELSTSDWKGDLSAQAGYGVGVNLDIPVLPFDITGNIMWFNSSEEEKKNAANNSYELSSTETHLGILKGFAPLIKVVRPYVALGLATNDVKYTQDEEGKAKTTVEENVTGYWGALGMQINFAGFQAAYDIRSAIYPEFSKENRNLTGTCQAFSIGVNF